MAFKYVGTALFAILILALIWPLIVRAGNSVFTYFKTKGETDGGDFTPDEPSDTEK